MSCKTIFATTELCMVKNHGPFWKFWIFPEVLLKSSKQFDIYIFMFMSTSAIFSLYEFWKRKNLECFGPLTLAVIRNIEGRTAKKTKHTKVCHFSSNSMKLQMTSKLSSKILDNTEFQRDTLPPLKSIFNAYFDPYVLQLSLVSYSLHIRPQSFFPRDCWFIQFLLQKCRRKKSCEQH